MTLTGGPLRVSDLPGGIVRATDIPQLALREQIIQRAHGLFDRSVRIGAVHLVQVDIVGTETGQARFHCLHDVTAGAALHVVTLGGHRSGELGRDNDFRPAGPERFAEPFFRLAAVTVDIGRVKQVYPQLQCALDHGGRLGLIVRHPEVHASQADVGYLQPRIAELLELHNRSPR